MPPRLNIILCVALLLVCVAPAPAQRRRAATRRNAPATTATTATTTKPAWTISTERSQEEGSSATIVKLEAMPLAPAPRTKAQAQLMATFTADERPKDQAAYVALTFMSRDDACQFALKDANGASIYTFKTDLKLQLDAKPLNLTYQENAPIGEGVWWVAQETEEGICAESVGAQITPQTLAKITAAKKVTANIGTRSFTFPDATLNALRAFARSITQTSSQSKN